MRIMRSEPNYTISQPHIILEALNMVPVLKNEHRKFVYHIGSSIELPEIAGHKSLDLRFFRFTKALAAS